MDPASSSQPDRDGADSVHTLANKQAHQSGSADTPASTQPDPGSLESRHGPSSDPDLSIPAEIETSTSSSAASEHAPRVQWVTSSPGQLGRLTPPSSSPVNSEDSTSGVGSGRNKAKSRGRLLRDKLMHTPRTNKKLDLKATPESPTLVRPLKLGLKDSPRENGGTSEAREALMEREREQAYDLRVRYRPVITMGDNKGKLKEQEVDGHLLKQLSAPGLKRQLNAHVEATRIDNCSDLHTAIAPAQTSLYGLIEALSTARRQESMKPKDLQQPGTVTTAEKLLAQLTTELGQLIQLPDKLEDLEGRYGQLPAGTRLIEAMALATVPNDEVQSWIDNGFNLGHAARAAHGGLTLAELNQAAGNRANEKAVIDRLLSARQLFPRTAQASFLKSAAEIVKRGVKVKTLQSMQKLGIELHPDNLPDIRLDTQAELASSRVLGQGTMATVHLLEWQSAEGNERWVFKEATDEVADAGQAAGIPERGANLSGRIMATAKVSSALGIRSAPAAKPVMYRAPGSDEKKYGTLSRFVSGEMLESGVGAPAKLSLNRFDMQSIKKMAPGRLSRLAETYGFMGYQIDEDASTLNFLTTGTLTPEQLQRREAAPTTQFLMKLDFTSAPLLESLSNLGVLAYLTGQDDMHSGNLMKERRPDGQVEVQTIDNDMSNGKKTNSGLESIATPNPVTATWEESLRAMARLDSKASSPKLPDTIGREYRLELLGMQKAEFLSRYGQGLDANQADQAWTRMQAVQRQLLQRDMSSGFNPTGVTTIRQVDDWEANSAGNAHSYGFPKVIRADVKAAILNLDESTVKEELFGMLGPEEQAAAWHRVQAAQKRLQVPDMIAVVNNPADWTSQANLELMGLNPDELKAATDELRNAPDQWTTRLVQRKYAIDHSVTGLLAMRQNMATMQVEERRGPSTVTPLPAFEGSAVFDSAAMMAELFPNR
ncbi:hypothetical protein [uncultured Hydrogenophaga sp.]|uniref:hypothetical protein n=1 Tax=uncultured Hydrogenophaga sp. TaxID=199683 RepID=UPI00265EBC8D|nr:hypothetical protein [uncultured Hydrogenophaga sp.]